MKISIVRKDSCGSQKQTYQLPDDPDSTISEVLQYINQHIDGSLAYYLSCRRGTCAACIVRVNNENIKACITLAYDGMEIGSANDKLLIKDTVIHLGMPKESEFDIMQSKNSI